MFKYFGTDGIRGLANVKLTPEIAYKVGRYLGFKLANKKGDKFLIGRDTRISGQMLESALASGLLASGCDVYLLGVVATPLVSYVLSENDFVGGIMISASHNPYYDNGLKIMNKKGLKIDAFLQSEIEDFIDDKIEIPYRINDFIGEIYDGKHYVEDYLTFLKSTFNEDLSSFKIAVDAANGSTSELVKVFEDLNVEVDVVSNKPNGLNINDKCGSTHPETLLNHMQNNDYDLGVAYDGDGDRLVIIDDNNKIVDGDGLIYLIARYYKNTNQLNDDTVVVTTMSNIGLHKAFKSEAINVVVTDVGDKNVFEKMASENFVVGGEQSGHIILKNFSNMGDGLLVTLKVLSILKSENKKLSELISDLKIYPQLLKNITVKDKDKVLSNKDLEIKIDNIKTTLNDDGRILVRASGTEPLIRVMVEASSDEICKLHVDSVIETIKLIEA